MNERENIKGDFNYLVKNEHLVMDIGYPALHKAMTLLRKCLATKREIMAKAKINGLNEKVLKIKIEILLSLLESKNQGKIDLLMLQQQSNDFEAFTDAFQELKEELGILTIGKETKEGVGQKTPKLELENDQAEAVSPVVATPASAIRPQLVSRLGAVIPNLTNPTETKRPLPGVAPMARPAVPSSNNSASTPKIPVQQIPAMKVPPLPTRGPGNSPRK